jgi:hypothetical protein
VRKQQPFGERDDLDGAALVASVSVVVLGVHDGDLPPGQVFELGVQA